MIGIKSLQSLLRILHRLNISASLKSVELLPLHSASCLINWVIDLPHSNVILGV